VLTKGPAKKVTIYVNEDTQYRHGPLYEVLVDKCREMKIAGATVYRWLKGSARPLRFIVTLCFIMIFRSWSR
jgi:PII-like signaling protein